VQPGFKDDPKALFAREAATQCNGCRGHPGFLHNQAMVIQETGVHVLVADIEPYRHYAFLVATGAHE
jgi:hypothetical protein